MKAPALDSPMDQYEPELLVLAPESGEDLNTKSLVSQLLELGVAVELDKNWRLPTKPPKVLSAYKACLFPDTATKYDDDLNAFSRNGGYLAYFKYYPVSRGSAIKGVHHYYESYGRDVYFWTIANAMVEGGLALDHPDFLRTMRCRSPESMLDDCRSSFFAKYDRNLESWGNWGDPGYTLLLSNFVLADQLQDYDWLRVVNGCLDALSNSRWDALAGKFGETQLQGDLDHCLIMNAGLLMERGQKIGDSSLIQAGVELATAYVDACHTQPMLSPRYMRYLWSESLLPAPGLYWLGRLVDRRYRVMADQWVQVVSGACHDENGLWHHWADGCGKTGAFWSRAQQWPLLWMTESLKALDPASKSAAVMRREIEKTFAALRRWQHPEKGLWHLVIDDLTTRLESSASAGIIYCYDRLREMDAISDEYSEMIERAFAGLKSRYYDAGLASNCRGTGSGTPEYYRTRPMGYYNMSLFPAALVRGA